MSGNVWEWCNDRYDGDYYKKGPEFYNEYKEYLNKFRITIAEKAPRENPAGPAPNYEYIVAEERVLRGGSCEDDNNAIRCTTRASMSSTYFSSSDRIDVNLKYIGFRCVKTY